MTGAAQQTLARLSAGDRPTLAAAMELDGAAQRRSSIAGMMLAPSVRVLVQLGALLADDGPATSIAWLTQRAAFTAISADQLLQVLATVTREAGAASVATQAARLALALGYEPDGEPDER